MSVICNRVFSKAITDWYIVSILIWTHLQVWENVHAYLIFFQNIEDNISIEIATKKAITNKKPCLLDFAFEPATNKVIQTMSSMSFWQMSTLSLMYNERCCTRVVYMWENNYENRLFGKTLFYSWKELGNSEASINFFRLQKIHYLFL